VGRSLRIEAKLPESDKMTEFAAASTTSQQMAKGKRKAILVLPFASCYLKSPYRFAGRPTGAA
jgi:hypothetical protein